MGANFCYRVYDASREQADIIASWNQAVQDSLYESGHSYSGQIGMLDGEITEWHDLGKDKRAAMDYVSEHQQKWDPAMAASFIEEGKKFWLIGGWCSS